MQDDRWLRYFPRGSLTARPDLHRGQAEYFSLFLHRMGEMPLYPVGPHQPLVIRFLCLPTWSSTCCVRIEASGLSWRLVGKEMDREAGFEVGKLIRSEDRFLTAEEAGRLADLWRYLRFWSLPAEGDEDEDVFDGTTYAEEAAHQGQYHIAHRDDYEWGDTFGEFCELLLKLAAFAPR
jgi:hypothetical protein